MSVGFVTCPACFACYPRLSIHACAPIPVSADGVEGLAKAASEPMDWAGAGFQAKAASPAGRREQRIAFLERKRTVTIADLGVKAEGEDWHGVQDCASDLRDIDNELDGLRY